MLDPRRAKPNKLRRVLFVETQGRDGEVG